MTQNMCLQDLRLTEQLLAFGVKNDVPLSEMTSFRIGGYASFVLEPKNYSELIRMVRFCHEKKVPVYLLGRGTNILAPDSGFSGVVIRFDKPTHPPAWKENCVRVCAGTSLTFLAKESVTRGYMGMERLCGIPGTVGGACAMNAGAYGSEIKQILSRVRVFQDDTDRWIDVKPDQLGYRKSPFSFPNCIVLEAEFCLSPDNGEAEQRLREAVKQRKEKQPLEFPSAGSVFKRPKGSYAGMLVEQCGWKGKSVGGATVSEKHAGFIINTGGATERDVLELITRIQQDVLEKTGYSLECEIRRMEGGECTF